MRRKILIVLVVSFVACAIAMAAWAGMPYPGNSRVEWQGLVPGSGKVFLCPNGRGRRLQVTVRDQFNSPMEGLTVLVNFNSSRTMCLCRSVAGVTDANGMVKLSISGGLDVSSGPGCSSVTTTVTCLTVPLYADTMEWLSTDLNGDCSVNLLDQQIFNTDLLTNACRSDFTCDGIVNAADQAILESTLGQTCSSTGPEDYNFRPIAIDYAWVTGDTLRVNTSTEVWLCDSASVAIPLEEEIQINGVPMANDSTSVVPLAAGGDICYLHASACGTFDCPDLQIGPFTLHGTCEEHVLPWGSSWCVCEYIRLWSCRLYIPAGPGGVTAIGAVADPDSIVPELYESDNLYNAEVVAVKEPFPVTEGSELTQNVPNPFNPFTRITFSTAKAGTVVLRIYDLAGRPVRTVLNDWREPQRYEIVWDGRDESGELLASGVYFYQLEAPGFSKARKLLLLK